MERLARFFSDDIYPSEEEVSPRRSPRHFFPSQSGPEGGEVITFGPGTYDSYNPYHHDYRGGDFNTPYHDYRGGDFNTPYHDSKAEAPNSAHHDSKAEATNSAHRDSKAEAPNSPHRDSKAEAPNSPHHDSKVEAPNSPHHDSKVEAPNSPHHDSKVEAPNHLEIQQDDAILHKIDEIKDLFSGDKNSRKKAQENLITQFQMYSNQEIKRLKEYIKLTEIFANKNFNTIRDKRLHDAIETELKKMPSKIEGDLEALFSDDKAKREDVRKEFSVGLIEHFKQELQTAKDLFEWAKTFTKQFGPDEKWVQDGIKKQLEEVFKKCQTSDTPSMANAKLKEAIPESLKDGIPVKEIPSTICGRDIELINGKDSKALISALVKGAHPRWDNSKVQKKTQNLTKDAQEINNLNIEEVKQLIKNLQNANLIEKERKVIAYVYQDGKIKSFQITEGDSEKPPYAVLHQPNANESRFAAIKVPKRKYY
jgi:hypothetical protein